MNARRVGIAGLWHETNTYSARSAGLNEFEAYELLEGEAIEARHSGTRSVIGGFLAGLRRHRARAVPMLSAGAWPSGPVGEATFRHLRDRFDATARAAGRLDGILVNLHGAMVADGTDDVEAELIRVLRRHHGDVPIAAVLDLHANPSIALTELTDVLLAYRTYPHADMWECGSEAAALLARCMAGQRFVSSIAKAPILTCPLVQGTDSGAFKALNIAAAKATEEPGVARVSVLPGFAYSDSPRAGASVIAVSTESRVDSARVVADTLIERIHRMHEAGRFDVRRPAAAAAVARAASLRDGQTPAVLVDVGDNIGAGSAGDGTTILRELLDQRVAGAVVVIADAEVAHAAHAVGIDGSVSMPLGGKVDHLHGSPVDVTANVRALSDGRYVASGSWASGTAYGMGPTALLVDELTGSRLVVTSRATPPFHPEHLTCLEVDPASARILVAKGAVAWRSAYGDVARTVIEVDTPGACPIDPWSLARTNPPLRRRAAPEIRT